MATAAELKARLQGLLEYANDKTGATDTDLTSAVMRLAEGYGQGGGADLSSFYVKYRSGETVAYAYDPVVCCDWNSFIDSKYNVDGFFAAPIWVGVDYTIVVMTTRNYSGYNLHITEPESFADPVALDSPIQANTTYQTNYWVP